MHMVNIFTCKGMFILQNERRLENRKYKKEHGIINLQFTTLTQCTLSWEESIYKNVAYQQHSIGYYVACSIKSRN